MKVTIKTNPDAPVSTEILADAILAIAQGTRKLRAGRLQDRTLCMLIADAAPKYGKYPAKHVSIKDVRAVLDGIEALEATHLKKAKP